MHIWYFLQTEGWSCDLTHSSKQIYIHLFGSTQCCNKQLKRHLMQSDRINIPTHCGMAMDPEMQILYRSFKVKGKKNLYWKRATRSPTKADISVAWQNLGTDITWCELPPWRWLSARSNVELHLIWVNIRNGDGGCHLHSSQSAWSVRLLWWGDGSQQVHV